MSLAIAVGLTLWFGLDHYYKQRMVTLFFDGKAAFESGDYPAAENKFKNALRLAETSGDAKKICKIQNYLSNTYMDERKHTSAQTLSSASVSSCSNSGDPHDLVAAYINLATAYQYGGKSKDADDAFGKALALSNRRLTPDDPQLTVVLDDYGTLKEAEGNYSEAEYYLHQAVERWERVPSNQSAEIASGYNNLGQVLLQEGKLDEAESLFKKSFDIYSSKYAESSEFVTVVRNLAILYERKGKIDEAKTLLQTAISKIEKNQPSNSAQLQALRKDYQGLLQKTSR
jgi:tetratricopeptide (TPR) repeat protein